MQVSVSETSPAVPLAVQSRSSSARRNQQASLERMRTLEREMWEDAATLAPTPVHVSPKPSRTRAPRAKPAPSRKRSADGAPGVEVVVRRKFKHPLDVHNDEVALWLLDELHGSLTQVARMNLGMPKDSWTRAAWRAAISMEHTVISIPIKSRRRLYTLMRQITDPRTVNDLRPADGVMDGDGEEDEEGEGDDLGRPSPERTFAEVASATADHLVPELGMTLGHLSVFHILHARTQYVKHSDLEEHVRQTEILQPHALSLPIAMEEQPSKRLRVLRPT
jgi:hypothetical protein